MASLGHFYSGKKFLLLADSQNELFRGGCSALLWYNVCLNLRTSRYLGVYVEGRRPTEVYLVKRSSVGIPWTILRTWA